MLVTISISDTFRLITNGIQKTFAQLVEELPWVSEGFFRSEAAIVNEAAFEKASKNPGNQGIEDLETALKRST